jgi:hypothetical protein
MRRELVVDLAAPALRTGPDVAAADADREENHDPDGAADTAGLTSEARLENAPFSASADVRRF